MSTTDEGSDDGVTMEGPRICPECQGFGSWYGDMSGDERIIECVRDDCASVWTAPDRTEVSD